jgi:hypothetical protein
LRRDFIKVKPDKGNQSMSNNPYIAANISRRIAANTARVDRDNSFPRIAQPAASLVDNPGAMAKRRDATTRLRELWASLIPEGTPDLTQFFDWIDRFGTSVCERATRRTGDKARTKRRTPGEIPFTADGVARYASATMRGMSQDTAHRAGQIS